MPDWPILHPSGPQELCDILDSSPDLNRYVIWLDEAQSYLDGKGSSKVAELLTKLMLSTSVISVVIGTMWPKYWQELTVPPRKDQPDYSARVRKFLRLSNVKRIEVPDNFAAVPLCGTSSDRSEGYASERCPALRREMHRITQVLAGGVQLLEYSTRALWMPAVAR